MSKRDDSFFLLNAVDALQDIIAYTEVGHDTFIKEKMRQDAVERKFEILGEAVKNLSEDLRKIHPDIPWSHMARFRDMLSHHYFGIDYETVWIITQKDVPEVLEKISSLDEYILAKQCLDKSQERQK